jgi:hypothetical protein
MKMAKTKKVIAPLRGWEEHTWYIVDVAYFKGNPIHRALFFTGSLEDGEPSGYNRVVSLQTPGGDYERITSIFYLKAVRRLISAKQAEK